MRSKIRNDRHFREEMTELLKSLDWTSDEIDDAVTSLFRHTSNPQTIEEKLRDDEKRHHNALKKLSEKPFFQIDPNDFTVIFQGEEFAEDRYRKSKKFREKKDKDAE